MPFAGRIYSRGGQAVWVTEVSVQSCATIRGIVPRDSNGHDEPGVKVLVGLLAAGSVMGPPGGVFPVFQQPLCSLPVLVVATALDMGELWLHDRQLRRITPVAGGQGCMAVLVGPKQLAPVQGDDTRGCVVVVLLSLLD